MCKDILTGLLKGLETLRDTANAEAQRIDPSLQPVGYGELCGEILGLQAAIVLVKNLALEQLD